MRLPQDAPLLERMSKLCLRLTSDRDRDVALVARTAVDRFKVCWVTLRARWVTLRARWVTLELAG